METQKALLLGRRLYDEWSEFWQAHSDDVPFASYINNAPKYTLPGGVLHFRYAPA